MPVVLLDERVKKMMQKSAKMMKNPLKLLRKRFFDIFASAFGPEDVSNGVGHHLDAYI